MAEKSIVNPNKPDFYQLIQESSDEEILNILKKRKHYQSEAAELAIQEAIKRGIIYSEQDLFSGKFQETPSKFTMFPIIEESKTRNKIRKSIARILIIVGAVPAVWGILKIIEDNFFEGLLLTLFGGIWIFAAVQLMRTFKSIMVNLLLIMLFASVVYLISFFLEVNNPVIMDYAIPVILFSLIVYGLLFAGKLHD